MTKLSSETHAKILEGIVAENTYTTSFIPKIRNEKIHPPYVFIILVGVACGFGFLFGALI